ncbi:MAG: NADH-quinone oxidoreductase subunit NuoN [Alphaproteobacteria bacterium]|jgi:NADH-quinone oxidoreductase subunit N|nr:NADH-quinone oxidoreductase subunit NuoN [Alphaproteobacteria bacterium]MDP6591447.1 NADH-quinone oxidoreductase subunit NuoN [Alphaproteobacteria bacterium]MDP6817305.1 NADH-quinone oxidoreductase subunit NuoN [Alphaproteobacteria bacterium]
MAEFTAPDYLTALPEIFLAAISLIFLMIGVFAGNRSTKLLTWLCVAAMSAAFIMVLAGSHSYSTTFFGMFVSDSFSIFMKCLVLIGAAVTLIMGMGFVKRENMNRFEFPVLILFATLGMLLMISANDLIALYVGLELQSLSLYIVAAFRRESLRSSEAGLKYFVLGALSSGLLLYGCSMVYGFTGFTGFDEIAAAIGHGGGDTHSATAIGILIGLVFITAALAFKVSAVPFHMWTPDVYEGAPTPVTAFFAAAPKIAAMALLLRVLLGPFHELLVQWDQIIVFISIASMALGAFAAIGQSNIKRLIAYSSIGHIGYALVGLAAGTPEGVRGVLIYLAIYMVMSLGTFACILAMRRRGQMVEKIEDLAGLSKSNPPVALALAIFMFSMAGIPPMAGFFGKLYVFLAAIEEGMYGLAIIGVLTSAVGAYYYIRIVKVMYFDKPVESFDKPIGMELSSVLVGTGVVTLFFFAYPTPVLEGAQAAAALLFP